MSIEITVRHIDVSPGLQAYARERAEILSAEFPRVEYVHVILDAEKHRRMAEITVQGKNRIRVEADAETENIQASLDAAFEKVERQLRKHRDRVQEHRG